MQIKIEIDVRPEELRRFLGLPDVSGLQEDIVAFLRDKVGAASEFDAAQFVKGNFDVLRRTPGFKTILSRLRLPDFEHLDPESAAPTQTPKPKRKRKPRRPAAAKPQRGNDDGEPTA